MLGFIFGLGIVHVYHRNLGKSVGKKKAKVGFALLCSELVSISNFDALPKACTYVDFTKLIML